MESTLMEREQRWYDKHYKAILLVPVIMFIVALAYIAHFYTIHGDVINKDVSLTGGTSITVFDEKITISELNSKLIGKFPDVQMRGISSLQTGKQVGVIVETKANVSEIQPELEQILGYKLTKDNSSVEFSGATLSAGFYSQLRLAVILAFAFMAIVVFLIFRTFVPSFAIISCAFADIVMTLAVVDLMGTQLSVAGIIAFLMLIGYSVDTDILLTTRLLKHKEGNVDHRLFGAFKTGITMTLTAIVAVGASLAIIYQFSDTLKQIFEIILIGLFFDIFNTWITNVAILKWYMEAKKLD